MGIGDWGLGKTRKNEIKIFNKNVYFYLTLKIIYINMKIHLSFLYINFKYLNKKIIRKFHIFNLYQKTIKLQFYLINKK